MALHEVQLKGYSVRPGNLSLGTFDSYGIEQLHVTLDDTWSGLAVTATFNPPKGEPVEIRVPENGLIDVPAEATANEGTGSGGNYTDQSGQQWVCDEVDFAREVMVQRIDKAALDDTKPLAEQNAILATPIETPLTADEIAAYKALTAYAPDTVVQASDGAGVKLEYQRDVNIAIKKLEDAIASMTAT